MAKVAAQSVEQNIRVEDYLNDQLQSAADLENISTLLENVQKQHALLKEQVRGYSIGISHDVADDLLSFERPN